MSARLPALPEALTPSPGARSWFLSLVLAARRQAEAEWAGTPFHLMLIGRGPPDGPGVAPRDFRPLKPDVGRALMAGAFRFAGAALEVGPEGDPWNRPSPSRRFAIELHQFGWLRDLIACGESGPRQALRLVLEWERVFGRWNAFAWGPEVLERRIYNLGCALRRLAAPASDAERAVLLDALSRQARHLASVHPNDGRAAERAAAIAVAASALEGPGIERVGEGALSRLVRLLPATVLPDGGHASRSPETALQLLFDLLTVDDALLQLGRPPPDELARAIDRLTGALRFFTLPDGRLAAFQGGEEGDAADIEAARAHDDRDAPPPLQAPHSGYEKMIGGSLHVIVDAAPPPGGPFANTACAHPLALEICVSGRRLITNTGWSPRADAAQPLRLTPAASTAALADGSAGQPLRGFRARILGARLEGGAEAVDVRRHDAAEGVWLELSHDGWANPFGMTHERRLYLDIVADELRGEDRFVPLTAGSNRNLPFTVRFHLHPDVKASLARDQRSVLLQAPGAGGWWLRNDAPEVSIEPSVHLLDGRGRRTQQVVLRSQIRGDRGGRVRWKLAKVGPEVG